MSALYLRSPSPDATTETKNEIDYTRFIQNPHDRVFLNNSTSKETDFIMH
jgi:hypothetical protein